MKPGLHLNRSLLILSAAAAVLIMLSSCAGLPDSTGTADSQNGSASPEALTDIQMRLLESAEFYAGTTKGPMIADDRSYEFDCSGAMLAVYYRAGIDLEKCYTGYTGNGVKRLYSSLRDNKLIFNEKLPSVGDLIIWDNTYDRDGDGQFNDYFTHTGMVVDVARDGTITYIHDNYRQGFIYETMNLNDPHNPELNSPMRMRGSPPAPNGQSLAGELVRVFGRAWQLPKKFFRKIQS